MVSKNIQWLLAWDGRMVAKYGHPQTGMDWCRKLAYYMGEAGNDSPSNDAINTAKEWELNGFKE